jgi:hypothetical protein
MILFSHSEILFLILRKNDAMQQVFISYCENKFQYQTACSTRIQNIKHTCQSNTSALREGYLQQQGEKIFTSPRKQRVSPVACAQPDK